MKGAFAEVNEGLPEVSFAGAMQNMYCTVTVVESYPIDFELILLRYQPCIGAYFLEVRL